MSLRQAKTVDEDVEWVANAVFEVGDQRDCLEREDLPLMDPAAKHADEIPFHTLLKQIDETHRRGLDLNGEG